MAEHFEEEHEHRPDERERDLERGYYGTYGTYNPPYPGDTAYWSPMGNPFQTPYGSYTRFQHRNYDRSLRGPHSGRGPRGYQRSDERILEDINDRLTEHGQVDASNIEVRVENGEVTLTGAVDSRRTKRLVEDVCESVAGVRDVHNQLRIGQYQEAGRTSY